MCCCSFEDDAEERCKTNLNEAIGIDPSNAEAHHLMASYWLSKEDNQVRVMAGYWLSKEDTQVRVMAGYWMSKEDKQVRF